MICVGTHVVLGSVVECAVGEGCGWGREAPGTEGRSGVADVGEVEELTGGLIGGSKWAGEGEGYKDVR